MAGNQVSIAIDVTANANQALSGMRRVQGAVQGVGKSAQLAQNSVKAFGVELQGKGGANRFVRTGLQQAGYQFGDFAVQVGGGTNAMQAFGQQAPQLLQIFGPIGSIIGAGVAIFAAIAVTMEKTAKTAADATPKIKTLSEAIDLLNASGDKVSETFDVSVKGSFEEATKIFGKLSVEMENLLEAQRLLSLEQAKTKFAAVANSIRELIPELVEYDEAIKRITASGLNVERTNVAVGASAEQAADKFSDAIKAFEKISQPTKNAANAMSDLSDAMKLGNTDLAIKSLNALLAALTKSGISGTDLQLKLADLGVALAKAAKKTKAAAGANDELASSWSALEASINQFATANPLLTAAASQLRFQEEVNKALAKGLTLEKARDQASKKVMSEGDRGAFQLVELQEKEEEITAGYEKRAAARAKIGADLVAGEVKRLQTYSTAIAQLGLMTKGMAADVAAPLAVLQAEWKALDVPVGKAIAMTEDFIALMAKSKQASAKIKLIEIETGQGEQLASLNRQIELIKSGLDPSLAAQMASFEASIKATSITGEEAAAKLALLAQGYVAISAAMAEAKKAAAPGEALKAFDDEQLRILEATNAAVKEFGLLTQGVAVDVAAPLAVLQAHWEAIGLSTEDAAAMTEAYIASTAKLKEAQAPVASIKEQIDRLNKTVDLVGDSFATAFGEIITGSASAGDAFKRMAATIITEMIKMDLQAAKSGGSSMLLGLGKSLFGALLGGLGGAANGPGTANSFDDAFSSYVPSANGNSFYNGNIIPFAKGGVVNSPTLFPMANGAGLMGEAGPEAVMPLSRGANGKLGVSASSGAGTVVNIYNQTDGQVETKQDGNNIEVMIRAAKSAVSADISNGGQVYRAISQRFDSQTRTTRR